MINNGDDDDDNDDNDDDNDDNDDDNDDNNDDNDDAISWRSTITHLWWAGWPGAATRPTGPNPSGTQRTIQPIQNLELEKYKQISDRNTN